MDTRKHVAFYWVYRARNHAGDSVFGVAAAVGPEMTAFVCNKNSEVQKDIYTDEFTTEAELYGCLQTGMGGGDHCYVRSDVGGYEPSCSSHPCRNDTML